MPDYIQVQTYATCSPQTFLEVIERYRATLIHIGCTDQQVLTWFSELRWPTSEDDNFGDIYPLPFMVAQQEQQPIYCDGVTVSLYTESAVPSLEDPPAWLGFNLLFLAEHIRVPDSTLYQQGVGKRIWYVMRELARQFNEIGVYLTDEYQEDRSWRVLAEVAGDPWLFDLGIFPRAQAQAFADVPAGFQGTVLDRSFAFAQENRWPQLPWLEA